MKTITFFQDQFVPNPENPHRKVSIHAILGFTVAFAKGYPYLQYPVTFFDLLKFVESSRVFMPGKNQILSCEKKPIQALREPILTYLLPVLREDSRYGGTIAYYEQMIPYQ